MSEHDEDAVVERLLPCPFCGGEPNVSTSMCDPGWLIQCKECHGDIGWRDSEAEAIMAWNRRTCSHKPGDRLPGGLRVVPEEPTEAMVEAGLREVLEWNSDFDGPGLPTWNAYIAMLAASGD